MCYLAANVDHGVPNDITSENGVENCLKRMHMVHKTLEQMFAEVYSRNSAEC